MVDYSRNKKRELCGRNGMEWMEFLIVQILDVDQTIYALNTILHKAVEMV